MKYRILFIIVFLCLVLGACNGLEPSPTNGPHGKTRNAANRTPQNSPGKTPQNAPNETPQSSPGETTSPSYENALKISNTDLGVVLVDTRKIAHIIIKNTSDQEVRDLSITSWFYSPLSLQENKFPGKTGTCSNKLAPGASCTIAIEIEPRPYSGNIDQEVEFGYQVLSNSYSQKASVKVRIADSSSLVAADVIDFGTVYVGGKAEKEIKLENPRVTGDITHLTIKQTGSHFVVVNPKECEKISSLASCYLKVEFSPTHAVTPSEDIEITYELEGKTLNKTIKITAKAEELKFTTKELKVVGENFGSLRVPADGSPVKIGFKVINLKGSGPEDAEILGISGYKGSILELNSDPAQSTCLGASGKSLTPGHECDFVFKAKPKTLENNFMQVLKVSYKAKSPSIPSPAPTDLTVTLKGKFEPSNLYLPYLKADPIDIGSKIVDPGSSFNVELVVKNPSIYPAKSLTIERVLPPGLSWASYYSFQLDKSSSTCTKGILEPNKECKFVVTYSPIKDLSSFSEHFKVSYKDPGDRVQGLIMDVKGSLKIKK